MPQLIKAAVEKNNQQKKILPIPMPYIQKEIVTPLSIGNYIYSPYQRLVMTNYTPCADTAFTSVLARYNTWHGVYNTNSLKYTSATQGGNLTQNIKDKLLAIDDLLHGIPYNNNGVNYCIDPSLKPSVQTSYNDIKSRIDAFYYNLTQVENYMIGKRDELLACFGGTNPPTNCNDSARKTLVTNCINNYYANSNVAGTYVGSLITGFTGKALGANPYGTYLPDLIYGLYYDYKFNKIPAFNNEINALYDNIIVNDLVNCY